MAGNYVEPNFAYQLDNREVLHQISVSFLFKLGFAYCRVKILSENQTRETQVQ
jgi:hypothetical protein